MVASPELEAVNSVDVEVDTNMRIGETSSSEMGKPAELQSTVTSVSEVADPVVSNPW
jgi:hypothetical protein